MGANKGLSFNCQGFRAADRGVAPAQFFDKYVFKFEGLQQGAGARQIEFCGCHKNSRETRHRRVFDVAKIRCVTGVSLSILHLLKATHPLNN